MADEQEQLSPDEEEVQGGAVKSFLEHLEDLRWTIIRSGAAILVGMIVCLFGANYLTAILKWPLERAALITIGEPRHYVTVKFAGQQLATYEVTNNMIGALSLGTNEDVTLLVEPTPANLLVGNSQQSSNSPTFLGPNGSMVLSVRAVPGEPGKRKGVELVFLDPAEPFLSTMSIGFFWRAISGVALCALFPGPIPHACSQGPGEKTCDARIRTGVGTFLFRG